MYKGDSTMKEVRLQRIVDEDTFNKIIDIYKEAKETHNIDIILAVKSFITRIIEAQDEFELLSDGKYHNIWVTPKEYVNNVICNHKGNNYPSGVFTALNYITYMVNSSTCPFDYRKEKHFNRTL